MIFNINWLIFTIMFCGLTAKDNLLYTVGLKKPTTKSYFARWSRLHRSINVIGFYQKPKFQSCISNSVRVWGHMDRVAGFNPCNALHPDFSFPISRHLLLNTCCPNFHSNTFVPNFIFPCIFTNPPWQSHLSYTYFWLILLTLHCPHITTRQHFWSYSCSVEFPFEFDMKFAITNYTASIYPFHKLKKREHYCKMLHKSQFLPFTWCMSNFFQISNLCILIMIYL